MKLLPAKASRVIGRSRLKIQTNSPAILLAAGIVGVVGTTVLASRATLKAQPVVDDAKLALDRWDYEVNQAENAGETIPEDVQRKRRVQIYTEAAIKLTKLYGPAIIVGGISIGCLIKGHNISSSRYNNMAAAYVGLQESLSNYRKRVAEVLGDKDEKDLYNAGQDLSVIEPGPNGPKKKTERVFGPDGGSPYSAIFGPDNKNWKQTPEWNSIFLRQIESYLNTKLRRDGHLFLNRAYEELGLPDTEAGAVVGWLYERGTGDDYVDFGIWDETEKDRLWSFMTGNEGEIRLDFNVDGPIHTRLNLPKKRN